MSLFPDWRKLCTGNPQCERFFSACCEQLTNDVGEVRYLKLLPGPGKQCLCQSCFEKEVEWRRINGLYTGLMHVPQWEEAEIFKP
jgi:hypothetical protein